MTHVDLQYCAVKSPWAHDQTPADIMAVIYTDADIWQPAMCAYHYADVGCPLNAGCPTGSSAHGSHV